MNRVGREGRTVTKLHTVRRWVASHLGGISHERRVSAIGRRLVEESIGLHTLSNSDLHLLKLACLVHDVGRCQGEKDHPSAGAQMIETDELLPFKNRRRRELAYLTLYHRGEVPEAGEDMILRRSDDHKRLRLILGFLRAADALDCRSLRPPRVDVMRRGRRLRIVCRLTEDSAKARKVFSRRKKFRLLEEVLGCRVEVCVEINRRLRLAA